MLSELNSMETSSAKQFAKFTKLISRFKLFDDESYLKIRNTVRKLHFNHINNRTDGTSY
jgi:hypothetical protein